MAVGPKCQLFRNYKRGPVMFLSFISLNFALVSDSGASCAEVSGSYLENHTKTQHLYAV